MPVNGTQYYQICALALSYNTKYRVFTITEENRAVTQWHVLMQLVYIFKEKTLVFIK